MRRNPTESDWAQIEHYLLIALARSFPVWVSSVRLAEMSLVQPGLIARGLRRLLAEGKAEKGLALFRGPNPSIVYRLVDRQGGGSS
jgi:hypothetical protein